MGEGWAVEEPVPTTSGSVERFLRLLFSLASGAALIPENLIMTPEVVTLRDRYIEAGILAPTRLDDAAHVALAMVAEADLIVSWNFCHLVHFEKIRQYNAVNLTLGYKSIEIRSPREVIHED